METTVSKTGPRSSRRPQACERCNRRRVKCDASLIGHPCSGCLNSGILDCRLVQSKRTRGSGGRFIAAVESRPTPRAACSPPVRPPPSKQATSPKTAENPQFSLHLGRLCDDGDDDASAAATMETQPRAAPTLAGESWFASFLTHNSASGKIAAAPLGPVAAEAETPLPATLADTDAAAVTPALLQDLPPKHLMQRLIDVFFARFHVYLPILDKSAFLSSVENGTVSPTLLRSVLFVGSTHCDPEVYHLLGFSRRNDAGDYFFGLAKASFEAGSTSDRTDIIQSCFLLHYWWGQPTAFQDSLWWFSVAIRSAQCIGMHKTTANMALPARIRILWRRIWWCLYVRDRQIAFALGVPMVINEMDCNVESLAVTDFPDESLETASYLIEQVRLNQAASDIFFRHCSPARLPLSTAANVRREAQQEISATLQEWHDGLSHRFHKERGHYLYLTLDLCYYLLEINLHQRLQSQNGHHVFLQPEKNKMLEAANNITRLVEDAMMYWSPDYFPMIWVTALFVAMSVQFVAYKSLNDQGREIVMAKLRTSLIALKQFEEYYILARWLRILWNDIFDRSGRRTTSHQRMTRSDMNEKFTPATQMPLMAQQSGAHPQVEFDDAGERWLRASPYSTTDWPRLEFSWDCETDPVLPLATSHSLDFDGLQFLTDLGLGRHYT